MTEKQNYQKDIFFKKLAIGQVYEQLAQTEIIKFYNNKYHVIETREDNK